MHFMNNNTILITGATGALGMKTAHTFAGSGHSLVLLGNDQTKLDALTRDLDLSADRIFASVVDLRNGEAVRSLAEAVSTKFGALHGLIHLVGGWVGGKTMTETSVSELEAMLDQHVWTTFQLFQSFTPLLIRSHSGRVIVVSASTVPHPPGKTGVYTAAKAAQENLVLTLAAELKEQGVTANILQVRAIDAGNTGKGTSPGELVAAMKYLFSEDASKVSGARIPIY